MRTRKLDVLRPKKGARNHWGSFEWLHVAVREAAQRLPVGLFGTTNAGYHSPAEINQRTPAYGSSATSVSREPLSVLNEILGRFALS